MSQSRPEQTQHRSGRRRNGLSLQTRLVIFVLLVALVPLIGIAIRDIVQTQQALTNAAEDSLKSSAAQTANSLDNFIQNTLDSVGTQAQYIDFKTYLTIAPFQRSGPTRDRPLELLKNLRSNGNLYIKSYALVDTEGNVVLDSSGSNTQTNESEELYFLQARDSDKPIVSAVTYADDRTTRITFASKVISTDGEYVGILRVKYYSAILQNVVTTSVGPSTDTSVLLLDELNIRMADSLNPALLQKSIVPLEPNDYLFAVETHRLLKIPSEEQTTNYFDFASKLSNAKKQPFFSSDITPTIPGDDTVAVAFLKTKPWTLTYSRPTSIFLSDVQKQIRTNIILVISISIIIAMITALIARSLTNPIVALAKVANSISQGDLSARAKINTTDEIGMLASAFNSMTDQLQSTLIGLEQNINERTGDLQKKTLELETVSEIARDITIIRDLDTLLNVAANLIRESFKYYHVGIFLVDDNGEFAYLRAASSVAAQQMLDQNYKLKVGQEGLVGSVTRTGQAYIALDVGKDAVHFQNPFLPQTRSEIALPLRNRSITIGALDIQTDVQSAFQERDLSVLQLLADQLAAAIENAQLVQQVKGTFAELNNAYRQQTQNVWQSTISGLEKSAYEYNGMQIQAVPQDLPINLLKRLASGKSIIVNEDKSQSSHGMEDKKTLLVPLMVHNQVIGVIGLEQEDPHRTWTEEEIAITEAAANRAGLTLENARLLEESQKRAIKERTIFEATTRIGSALNVENILYATAEEIERILGDSEVILQFDNDKK